MSTNNEQPPVVDYGGPYGRLRAQRRYGTRKPEMILCLCDPELGGCGQPVIVLWSNLRLGRVHSCGCLRTNPAPRPADAAQTEASTKAAKRSRPRGSGKIDHEGQDFGKLRVGTWAGATSGSGAALWNTVCHPDLGGCGRPRIVRGRDLREGRVTDCGCGRQRAPGDPATNPAERTPRGPVPLSHPWRARSAAAAGHGEGT